MTDINNKGPQVFASSEILGATLTARMNKSDRVAFESDPRSFIASSLNADIGDVSVLVVENGSGLINLALPYYSYVDKMSATMLNEDHVSDVSGGEIVIAIALLLTTTTVGLAVASSVTTAAIVEGKKGKRLDGSNK